MAKLKIADYNSAQNLNTDINNIAITGNALPSNFDDALRTVMAHLADMNSGVSPLSDTLTLANAATPTKKMRFSAANVPQNTTATLTMANQNVDLGTMLANIALAYTRNNIIGIVGQSSGTPTGAIIENGNNNLGWFVRYADGTQICWAQSGSMFYGDGVPVTTSVIFPVMFSSPPDGTWVNPQTSSLTYKSSTTVAQNNVGMDVVIIRNGSGQANTMGVQWGAIGRWF